MRIQRANQRQRRKTLTKQSQKTKVTRKWMKNQRSQSKSEFLIQIYSDSDSWCELAQAGAVISCKVHRSLEN